ncbi:MAG: hypothetical protein HRU06_06510 [Oceanospirillaceae bacterium]|nr:hypothetical protein [Oceanospirillaceae bacterium]
MTLIVGSRSSETTVLGIFQRSTLTAIAKLVSVLCTAAVALQTFFYFPYRQIRRCAALFQHQYFSVSV